MNTKEGAKRIAELESQVKKLYEKLGMSEEIVKPEFKVGDWVFTKHDTFNVVRITEIDDNDVFDFRFDNHFGASSENGFTIGALIRKATPTEIETALRKEWARRTKEKGWENPDKAEIEGHVDNQWGDVNGGEYAVSYYPDEDSLYTKNGCVYHDGNWATPKEKKSEVNPIVVNGYEAEFHEGCVQFGCAKIENSIFEELQEFIDAERPDVAGTIGNKAVTGFRIGEGIFDIETIKAITERL